MTGIYVYFFEQDDMGQEVRSCTFGPLEHGVIHLDDQLFEYGRMDKIADRDGGRWIIEDGTTYEGVSFTLDDPS